MGIDDQRIVINKTRTLKTLLIGVTLRETEDRALRVSIHHAVQEGIGFVD